MAIDKLNFSGINSGSESLVTPISSLSERLMKYGSILNQNALDEQKQKRLDDQDAYQKQRDAIADRRQEKIDKRSDLETASQDLYKNELFKGQQTKGGSYGEALSSEASKYDLTPDEQTNMQKYFANGSYDTNAMRKSGNNILADKVDWQTKVSNNVENFIASGVGKESRPEMYDRIGSMLVSKGYTPPESLVTSADQARLTEAKAEEEKLKDIETQRSEILKRNREDNWKVVNAKTNSGGETTYDADGNELYVGKRTANSLQKEFKTGVDNTGDSIKIIQESINKLDKIDPEKKSDAINQANSVINAVAARGIPIDEAARIVSNELTQKGDQSFFFEKFAPNFNQKSIDAYADQFVKNMPKKQNISYGSSNDGASKFDLALELAAQNKTSDSEALAKLNSDKAKLLAGEETRRANRIDEWLKSQGILGKSSEPEGITSVDLSKYKDFNIDRYANKAIGIESSGNSKAQSPGGGSYYGLGQLNKESVEAMGINWNDYKNNPDTQVTAFKNFTAKNVKDLEANGIPVNDFTVYVAHNQGVGGAKQILSGETPSKQVMLNMLNQGIDNNLPKIPKGKPGAGQIDIDAVMADKTITADFLNKEYAPVDNYLRKFSKKFDTEIDKVITPGSTRLEVKGQGDNGYSVTPNRLDKNKENAKAYMNMSEDQRKELADFSIKDRVTADDVNALRSQIIERNKSDRIQNLITASEQKDRFADNKVLKTYADKKLKQDSELSKSAFARTFGAKEEVGKYGKIWDESDNKKGSSLDKNIATLSSALDKDGFSSFEEVNKLYNSMPSGKDKDAVGELLNYKGMQNSQEWRDMKARQQYLEAGLTAASTIPIPAGLIAKSFTPFAEKVVAPIISRTVEKSAPLQIASDRAKLLLPDLNVGKGTSTVNNGLSLPNYQIGLRQWSNPNSVVATDKIAGRGISDVIEMSAPEQRAIQAQRQAIAAKKSLDETIPTNVSDLNYFGKELLSRNVKIADQKLKEFVNSGGKLSTKEGKRLKEEADKALLDYNRKYFYK